MEKSREKKSKITIKKRKKGNTRRTNMIKEKSGKSSETA
jgi:hypothetical protein